MIIYIAENFLRTIDENLEHCERHIEYFVRFKDLYINTMFAVHKQAKNLFYKAHFEKEFGDFLPYPF